MKIDIGWMSLWTFFYLMIIWNCQSLENLALGKECKQSSTANRDGVLFANRAVDSNLTSCSCTKFDDEFRQWWIVDLGITAVVAYLTITNNPDFPGRLHNFTIKMNQFDPSLYPQYNNLCYYHPETLPPGTTTFNCTNKSLGRYVEISKRSIDKPIHMCEVEVYGTVTTINVFCQAQSTLMEVSLKEELSTVSQIECARNCEHRSNCTGFNYQTTGSNHCTLLMEEGATTHDVNYSHWKKC